jgi:uncharacterized membrane protein YhaH (DUF805 family)
MVQTLSLSEIAHVIALATAPAFLLGAIVSFLSLLLTRMSRVMDRVRVLHEIDDQDQRRARLKGDMPLLRQRAKLVHYAMSLSAMSAVVTAMLVVVAFVGALVNFESETLIATLFVLSLLAFVVALCLFVHEAMLAQSEFQHYL